MKKICLFISSLNKGGSERVMVNLAGRFAAAGTETVLVTQYREKNEYPLPAGVRRVYSELTPEEQGGRLQNLVRRYRKLQRIWETEQPELILSFIGKNNIMAVLTARKLQIPVVVSVRSDPFMEYPKEEPLLRLAARAVFPKAAGIVLLTERCRDFFGESGKTQKKIVILPNLLAEEFAQLNHASTDEFAQTDHAPAKELTEPEIAEHCPGDAEQDRTELRTEAENAEKRLLLTAIGRLDENKNQAMMIRAYERIRREFPDSCLEIYGDGPDREKLEQLIISMDAEEQIRLMGSTDQVPQVLKRTAVFMLCSGFEGMPNALLEAMMLGTACIATDCPIGGPAEVIRSGENGILIPVNDEEALAAALRELLSDPAGRNRIAREAAKIAELYDPAKAFERWREYLDGIAEQNQKNKQDQ